MKTINTIIKISFLILLCVVTFSPVAYAQTPAPNKDYTLLAPLPGTSKTSDNCTGTGCKTDLQKYLPTAFNLAVGIAAGMAFVMIVFGGITYAVSDSLTGKEDGKKWATNAIYGLLLVIGAYVILYTINPQILDFKLSIPRPVVQSGTATVTPGVRMTDVAIAESNAIKNSLAGYGINTKGPCDQGQVTNCVNLNGLPVKAVNGLIALKQQNCSSCGIFISGGTEGGHATHGAGASVVDLRPDFGLNQFITGNANTPQQDGTTILKTLKDGTRIGFTFETLGGNARGTSSGAHWHVIFQ